jgi:VCBS repeat-containing protein
VAITIVDVNRAPAFTSTPPLTATEGQPYAYAFATSDPDGDSVTVTLQAGPSGVTVGASSLSWTPNGAQTGPQSFTLRASDGRGGTATQSFTVNVTAVNDPPVFTSTPVTVATEDQQYPRARR